MADMNLAAGRHGEETNGLNGVVAAVRELGLKDSMASGLAQLQNEVACELSEHIRELGTQVDRMRTSLDLLTKANAVGLEMIYLSRKEALEAFEKYLENYVKRADSELYVVGSSLKGLSDMAEVMKRVMQGAQPPEGDVRKKLNVLLTHPWYTRFRENQENRSQGDIADEVFQSIRNARKYVSEKVQIKFYKGTPTVFMIATTEKMLLNPYPYEKEAYHSFCLTVRNVGRPDSVYDQYYWDHFKKPWDNRRALDYKYYELDGPNPGQPWKDGPDFFVIQDAKDFYLAVFLKEEGGLPISVDIIPDKNGPAGAATVVPEPLSKSVLWLGTEFEVKLLRVSPDGRCEWIPLEEKRFTFNEDHRKGKVLGTHPGRFEEFSMIGIFSRDTNGPVNPHKHNPKWCPAQLRDQPLPLFWKWLAPAPGGDQP